MRLSGGWNPSICSGPEQSQRRGGGGGEPSLCGALSPVPRVGGSAVTGSGRGWGAGLDSTNAAAVVDILAGLAGGGTTVVMSVHQPRPDVLAMMRRALILSPHGRIVYSGAHAHWRRHHANEPQTSFRRCSPRDVHQNVILIHRIDTVYPQASARQMNVTNCTADLQSEFQV